jgi:hypothetical protein
MTGTDAIHTNDATTMPVHTEANAVTSAGAAMASKDSNLSFNAMKTGESGKSSLPDFQISDINADSNPYAKLTRAQKDEIMNKVAATQDISAEAKALHLPATSSVQDVDTAIGKLVDTNMPTFNLTESLRHNAQALQRSGDTKVLTDMTTNMPWLAKSAAEHYLDAVLKDQSPKTLSDLRDGFHNTQGNINAAEQLMGITTPVSNAVMNAMGNLLDKKAPAESAAQKIADQKPTVGFLIRSGN